MALTPEERARAEETAKIQAAAQANENRAQAAKFFKRIWLFGGMGLLLIVAVCTLSMG
jgi:hypothetical protein